MKSVKVGTTDVELADYMVVFPQPHVDALTSYDRPEDRILACGVDPSSGELYLTTFALNVYKIVSDTSPRMTSAFPSLDGSSVAISFEGAADVYVGTSSDLLHIAKNVLDGRLTVSHSYNHEDHACETEEDRQRRSR